MRMLALTALLCIGAAYPPQQAPQEQDNPTIVVTGRSLSDTEKALKACIERRCSPDQDVAAALAHAENQFVAGRYKDARGTLLAAAGRNRRHARDYPIPVSDLLRANARVAAHLGEGEAYKVGMIDSLDALKAGLPEGDARILIQRVEIADAFAGMQRHKAAEDGYRAVAREARARGLARIEAAAMLRTAFLWSHLAKDNPDYHARAVRSLDAMIASRDPLHLPFGDAARVMKAQLLARLGDQSAIDSLIANYVQMGPSTRPVLLYSEPIAIDKLGSDFAGGAPQTADGQWVLTGTSMRRTTPERRESWIDVVFWIRPDGRPADIEVARRSGRGEEMWERLVTRSIAVRRYAPLRLDSSDPGLVRVERYSLTANYELAETGSHLRTPGMAPRIERIDLTAEPAKPVSKGR
jgi:hypothetical protein